MPFFKRNKQAKSKPSELTDGNASAPARARYQNTWTSVEVIPDEIEELVHLVTAEMKLRAEALDTPFLLLPFRPSSDPSPARSFINSFYKSNAAGSEQYRGSGLQQEIRLTDPAVLCSILKWCWSRMPKGVVSWPVYESFQLGEKEAGMTRNAFTTFVPLGCESQARQNIITDFYDLIAAIAAHGKLNGLGGRKLSRLAGWWAFEHSDGGKGFEGGYRSWSNAADASSHLFFAYLRSLSPDVDPSMNVIERIPRSLQALLAQTEYPPEPPTLLQRTTPRVIMVVDQVSPSPFSLLRRAKHFEYRQSDRVLKDYSDFEDPVDALTDECRRVLNAIASTNSSGVARSRHGLAKPDESWSSFTSTGFGDINPDVPQSSPATNGSLLDPNMGLSPRTRNLNIDRPTTPSWGDFMSSGFQDEVSRSPSTMLLPPDKVLPPIASRTQTPSIMSGTDIDEDVTPGELAAIASVELDDAFWWVWMTSLAGEEPNDRKAVFGRCALIETTISNGKWLIMEEQVKGASPDPLEGAQVLEKKSRFSFSRRSKLGRGKSGNKRQAPPVPQVPDNIANTKANRMTIGADQQAKIKAAAAELSRKNDNAGLASPTRRGRQDEAAASKTNSTFTMGLQSEAGPAMKWANTYDKDTIRSAYLSSNVAGTGQSISTEDLVNGSSTHLPPAVMAPLPEELPADVIKAPEPEAEASASPTTAPAVQPVDAVSKEMGISTTGEHPALRDDDEADFVVVPREEPDSNPAIIAAKMALEGRSVSPELHSSNKLKKQPGQSGLKKFFSRNKDKTKRQSSDVNPGAVIAANDAGRRMVSLRQNTASSQGTSSAAAEPQLHEPELVAPVMPASQGRYNHSTAGLSTVDSEDHRNADIEFSRFDQGPLEDMPASNARESVDYHSDAAEPPTIARYSPRNPEPVQRYAPPPLSAPQSAGSQYSTTHDRIPSVDDVQSEATMEERREPALAPLTTVDSSKDRWERIRENAARRAANAKAADESSSVSHRPTESGKTDDGETSGEETIESRVARIKARVAELTGNMDNSALRR